MDKAAPTVTVAIAVPEHPLLVPVTVYEVVDVGDFVIELAVEPLDHKKVETPVSVSVTYCPEQNVSEFTVTSKGPPTQTVST
ncbi:MAG: NmrA family NAD(P)-binding protein [Bacteroidetes bacterium]|nr:NmrA family NAD(P)-binding protein [Bacteroidota bacterium]